MAIEWFLASFFAHGLPRVPIIPYMNVTILCSRDVRSQQSDEKSLCRRSQTLYFQHKKSFDDHRIIFGVIFRMWAAQGSILLFLSLRAWLRISVLCNSRAPRKRGHHRWAPPTVLMLWYHSMTSGDTIDPAWTGAEPVLVEPVQTGSDLGNANEAFVRRSKSANVKSNHHTINLYSKIFAVVRVHESQCTVIVQIIKMTLFGFFWPISRLDDFELC